MPSNYSYEFVSSSEISSPTALMLSHTEIIYILNEYPYTRYISDGRILKSLTPSPHRRYFFHGCAQLQTNLDTKFRDMTGNNHGTFGANLSVANAWTSLAAGFVSTVDPSSGVTDSVIRIPGPNFDYLGKESLLIMWAGSVTPEGSDATLMGTSSSTTHNGWRIRCSSTGRVSIAFHDTTPTSLYSSSSTDTAAGKPFVSGEYHTFALLADGQTRKISIWVDGVINLDSFTMSSGADCNTLSSNTFNIGSGYPSPGNTEGIATKTYAIAGFKFLATDTLPTNGQISSVYAGFDRDPSKLILDGAF